MRFRASKNPSLLGSEEHSDEEPSVGMIKSLDPFWNLDSALLRGSAIEECKECSSAEHSCQSPFSECIATTYPTEVEMNQLENKKKKELKKKEGRRKKIKNKKMERS